MEKIVYINMKNSNKVETIDEFETRKEASKMLKEYRLAGYGNVYLSSKCTREWKNG